MARDKALLSARARARYGRAMKTTAPLLVLALVCTAGAATAQTPPTSYKLQNMNFDMWCQEQKHYPPERCDKRLPADDKEFKAYRQTVENYELEYLKKQRQGQELDRDILHNDPVDNPHRAGTAAPGSEGTDPEPAIGRRA